MTASIAKTIEKLADSASAKIDISTTSGSKVRLNCIYKESDSPHFSLVSPPGKLPTDIDTRQLCPVSVDNEEAPLTFSAKIVNIDGDRTLDLVAEKKVTPESLREFFRVDVRVPITAGFTTPSPAAERLQWSQQGKTLDISGSGVLVLFSEEPKTKYRIKLSIDIPGEPRSIECQAHIVRTKHIRRSVYQVSFHFDTISDKDKDTIISFCLKEQRRRLRDQIQTDY